MAKLIQWIIMNTKISTWAQKSLLIFNLTDKAFEANLDKIKKKYLALTKNHCFFHFSFTQFVFLCVLARNWIIPALKVKPLNFPSKFSKRKKRTFSSAVLFYPFLSLWKTRQSCVDFITLHLSSGTWIM